MTKSRLSVRMGGVLLAWAAASGAALLAQMHKVEKPEQVVRAVGVYEWTGDLNKPKASRLVPVSIYIDGEFQDAGVYVARPVPFALLTGNVYELQASGLPKGTLDLSFARHLQATDAQGDELFDDGWLGYGVYHAPPLVRTAAKLKPSKTLPVITGSGSSGGDSSKPKLVNKSPDAGAAGSGSSQSGSSSGAGSDDSDRPTMHRRDSDSSTASSGGSGSSGSTSGSSGSSGSSPSSGGSSSGSSTNSSSGTATSTDDSDRPTMHRRADTDSTASNSGSGSSGGSSAGSGSSADDDPDRPTLKRRTPEEQKRAALEAQSAGTGASLGLNNDPDRPTLHHGKPAGSMDDEDLPALKGIPTDMHQMVAVSDAKDRPTHEFVRPWLDDTERGLVLAKMEALARAQLATYKSGPAPVAIAASGTAGAAGSSAATPAVVAPKENITALETAADQDPGAPTLKRGKPQPAAPPPPDTPASTTSTASAASTNASSTSASTTTHKTATKTTARSRTKKASATPTEVPLLDEQLHGFTLSYGGDPTFVYTAHTDGTGVALRYVTVVAQGDGIGGGVGTLHVAMTNVTDAMHLDRTPRLRLVDAVDAEASNRASLLFELRGQSSRQFALYRLIAARPEQLFVTGTTE